MQKNGDQITMSENEAEELANFIWNELYCQWERYTDTYCIANEYTLEEGMRKMNRSMYEMYEKLQNTLNGIEE